MNNEVKNIRGEEKYNSIKWTNEQKEMLIVSFNNLDKLMYSCQTEKNSKKISAINKSYGIVCGVLDTPVEVEQNNLERAKNYMHLYWTEEQKRYIHIIFENLDRLMYSCQKEVDIIKIATLSQAHMNIHDILIALTLEELYG